MKGAKKILLACLSLCVFLGAISGALACKKDTPESRVSYTVTVACEDEDVFESVRVQLFLDGKAATEAKGLNAERKATFELKPETYTVVLSGTNDYTYPETTVKADNPNVTVSLTRTYAVRYDFGSDNGTDYEGNSTLLPVANKEEGAAFNLAEPLVWEGHTFDGWSDGSAIYEAGEEYVMPAHAVTLTAQWYNWPEGQIKSSVSVPAWNQDATTGGYRIEKGESLQLTASFSGKGLEGTEWAGIVAKIYRNCDISKVGTFYQFRPDFAVDRRNWDNWQEDNRDFNVTDTNWDKAKYISLVSSADVVITVALSADGVLTYTIELTSENYNYKRVFSPKNTTMDSALVIFGTDGVTAANEALYRPMPSGVKLSFDWGYDNLFDIQVAEPNSTYTFEDIAYRDGYTFLGWQENGAGKTYNSGDTYAVGTKRVRFYAAWEVDRSTPGLAFTELADGTYAVKKGSANAEHVVIPNSYKGKPVTQIGSMAFMSVKWIKTIEIPDTVTTISGSAFYGSSLEEIYIPDSVTSIGASAFKNCASLAHVRVPSGMKSATTDAFANCEVLEFNEADNALYLGNEQNEYVVLVKAKNTSITSCAVANGCELIYDLAFSGCTELAEVTFPNTLRIIGGRTFKDCSSLTELVIPDSVTGIGGLAFGGCSGLQRITIPFVGGGDQGGSNHYSFGYIFGATKYTGGTETQQTYPGSNNENVLGKFYVPTSLREVTVTGGELYQGAFENCGNITTIRLPATVKSIPVNAFKGCTNLTDLYYGGTQADWQRVTVAAGNDPLGSVTMHYKED